MRTVFLSFALTLAACAHGDGTKGGLVTVRADAAAIDQGFAGRRFALLVGIDAASDERWRPLKFAAKDARDFAAALGPTSPTGFTSTRVLTEPRDTTREALRREVRAFAALATRPEDTLLVYVSAHGTLDHDAHGELKRYLVTSDAEFHRVSQTALEVDELLQSLGASASRRRVVVLATCHSGGGKSMLNEAMAAELASTKGTAVPPLELASRASLVFSASDRGEVAREDETLGNDVYTHFFIEALGGAGDRNGDGAVAATEAHDYARRRTWAFSGGRQRPAAEIVEVGADPVLLTGHLRGAGQPELFSYAARLDGFTLKVDDDDKGELPGGAAVTPGAHTIELTKGGEVLLRDELVVRDGERVDLDTLTRRREPNTTLSLVGGGLGFIDTASRQQLLPAVAAVGGSVRVDRVGFEPLSLSADVSGFHGSGGLKLGGAPVPFTWTSVVLGLAALLRWEYRFFSLWGGVRVAGWWLARSFSLSAYSQQQLAFSMTPGAQVGVGFKLATHWEVSLNAQMMLTVLSVDGVSRPLGFAGGWLAVGYRL